MFESIVALATPPMKSALAIVRISGDDCFELVNKVIKKDLTKITKNSIIHTQIVNGEKIIDDVVLAVYKGPKSFTGENSVEIMCHGSMLIANQIIELLIKNGARYATNGEYTSRAFLHGKLDLIQAESINDLINATTNEAKELTLMSLKGEISALIYPIKSMITDILSLIEVNIDFPEYEDIEIANKEKIIDDVDKITEIINPMISDGHKAIIIKEGIKVAIVGKPNVGKSSLLNALSGEDKAIVTNIEGTTRDIVESDINLNGIVLHLLDTAGIRETNDLVESIGVNKSKQALENADLVIVVLDGSKDLDDQDQKILEMTKDLNRIVTINKKDIKQNKENYIEISALNHDIKPLVDEIYRNIGIEQSNFSKPALNNTRQVALLERCKESLLKAKEDALNDLTVDLISISLLDAYKSVLQILGEENQIDISKEIFSRFCVGK